MIRSVSLSIHPAFLRHDQHRNIELVHAQALRLLARSQLIFETKDSYKLSPNVNASRLLSNTPTYSLCACKPRYYLAYFM